MAKPKQTETIPAEKMGEALQHVKDAVAVLPEGRTRETLAKVVDRLKKMLVRAEKTRLVTAEKRTKWEVQLKAIQDKLGAV